MNQMNPMQMLLQMTRAGQNPMSLLQSLSRQNPQVAQAMRLIQGKNPEQLRKTAENLAKERGYNLEQIAQQMGISLPK